MTSQEPGFYVRRVLHELGFESATTLPEPGVEPTTMDVNEATRTKIEPFLKGEKTLVINDDGSFKIEK